MDNIDYGVANIDRKNIPHHATITLKIDIRKINLDGSLDPEIMDRILLQEYGISNKAQICVSGPTESDCIKNVINLLEKLNG